MANTFVDEKAFYRSPQSDQFCQCVVETNFEKSDPDSTLKFCGFGRIWILNLKVLDISSP